MELWGVPFDPLDQRAFVAEILRRLSRGERGIAVFTPDARALSLAILRPDIRDLLRRADLVACDGVGIALAARAFGVRLPRVTGVDLAWGLCRAAEEGGLSIYLLGTRERLLRRAVARLRRAFPRLAIAGYHHGYFPGAGPVEEIRGSAPDILLVGLGFPKQERWILAHRGCGAGALIAVGSTFDIWAGRFPRAPVWVRRAGFEWL
ncbi:MAG: WecB/TagA/CpsF family glycosyltransferase, partial [Caldiserica bacterium]|nr:WecB/TagA/CpsF family glycosyltransferase [Caldisericota bacterium]